MAFYADRFDRGPFHDIFGRHRARELTSPHTHSRLSRVLGIGIGLVACLTLLRVVVGIYTDWLWFDSLGYAGVYVTRMTVQIGTFVGFGLAFAVLLTGNVWLAGHIRARTLVTSMDDARDLPVGLLRLGWGLAIGVQALVMASIAGGFWASLLRFSNATDFGVADPILQRDASFYVFQLPVYREIQVWLLWAFLLVMVNVALAYALNGNVARLRPEHAVGVHLSVLGGAVLALVAWHYQLDIFGLLFSHRGVTEGASYTDVHAQYGAYQVMTFVSALAAVALIANAFVRRLWLWIAPAALWTFALLVGVWIIPAFVQQFRVKPNELSFEGQYIANNIAATRQAFNLGNVDVQDIHVQDQATQQDVAADQTTVRNIRLLDYRPLQTTYNQIQSIRQYYTFPDIDVDRYTLDGQYQQVILGARELDPARLASQAKTWVNLHLQYTHGYGLAMSPVADVSSEGLPILLERDLPPQGVLKIDRPEIYYGNRTSNWVIVDTRQQEFDFPQGDQNVFNSYAGSTSVGVGSLGRRLAFAWRFADLNIAISNSLTADSKILFYRTLQERLQAIAPFLRYDRDPYLVVDSGRLFWIQDAYTTSNDYPYSQSLDGVNYIRNSVKIIIDAYHGTTTFYVADAADPIIRTYGRIFPELFRPIDDMPAGLRAHVRYPEDLFLDQMEMYQTYHMTEPQVFYNREDMWALPEERFAQTSSAPAAAEQARAIQLAEPSSAPTMQPYYVLMRLPGEAQNEFLLLLPFTPSTKSNMISWVVARSDGAQYGKLLAYRLPKDKLIYGPMQIQSRIDQDPTISGQLTLWNQQGSQVLRGNMLVIPIGQSFLFVEPLYLQSQSSPLPELKRVIVANGDRIAMAETLDQALNQVFASAPAPAPASASAAQPAAPSPAPAVPAAGPSLQPLPNVPGQITALAADANQHYARAQDAWKAGDFVAYGQELAAVQRDLQQLAQLSGAPAQ